MVCRIDTGRKCQSQLDSDWYEGCNPARVDIISVRRYAIILNKYGFLQKS